MHAQSLATWKLAGPGLEVRVSSVERIEHVQHNVSGPPIWRGMMPSTQPASQPNQPPPPHPKSLKPPKLSERGDSRRIGLGKHDFRERPTGDPLQNAALHPCEDPISHVARKAYATFRFIMRKRSWKHRIRNQRDNYSKCLLRTGIWVIPELHRTY